MTGNNHPITPPPKLLQQWWDDTHGASYEFDAVATQAARWGADQELEACCQALFDRYDIPSCISPKFAEEMRDWLRAVRRPKPLTLKEQALQALDCLCVNHTKATAHENTIRHALEQLND